MSIGIRTIFANSAVQSVVSSTVLVDVTGLSFSLAPGQRAKFRCFIPCAVAGAVSGIKFQMITTVVPARYVEERKIFNGSTNAVAVASVVTAQTVVSNALANIANHMCDMEGEVVGGATASILKLQFAQLVSDPAAASVLAGASMEITTY
jgi:hypothetical protein